MTPLPRTTEEDLIWARSGKKPINIVRWGPYEIIPEPYGGGRMVSSKAKGHKLMAVWKRWYQRKGWEVRGGVTTTLCAYPPGALSGKLGYPIPKPHTCWLQTHRLEDGTWTQLQ